MQTDGLSVETDDGEGSVGIRTFRVHCTRTCVAICGYGFSGMEFRWVDLVTPPSPCLGDKEERDGLLEREKISRKVS